MQRGIRVETLRDAEYEAPSSAIAFDYSDYDTMMASIFGYDIYGQPIVSPSFTNYPVFAIESASV
jgi:hypothetical protein